MEDKAKFVEAVGQALRDYSRENVVKAEYMEIPYTHDDMNYTREIVRITFKDGWQQDIGVSCSSCLAMLNDLYKGLL